MFRIILLFFLVYIALPLVYASAQSSDASQDSIEVVVGGKRYPSLHAYKLQRLKDDLRGALSPAQLREFSTEEIYAVIQQLKDQPPVMTQPPSQERTVPAEDPQVGQMEEMLKGYRAEHPDDPSLEMDPQKIKTIIIKPSSQGQR